MKNDAASAPEYPDRPELALVALLEMLYRSRSTASPAVAASIRDHLLVIAADARHPIEVRDAAKRMAHETPCALQAIRRCIDRVPGSPGPRHPAATERLTAQMRMIIVSAVSVCCRYP